MDPRILAMMQMQQQQGAPQPGVPMPGVPQPDPGPAIPDEMSDEDMLDNVQGQMGAPPPMGGLKWENLAEDQAALEEAPTDENVTAFVDYWGEENLPKSMSNPDNVDNDADDVGE